MANSNLQEPLATIFKILFDWFNEDEHGELMSYDFKYFKNNHGISVAMLRSALHSLTDKKYLSHRWRKRIYGPLLGLGGFEPQEQEEEFWVLGEKALAFAYPGNHKFHPSHAIPAADRFVSISDNQIDTSQAIAALDELSEAIRSSNDLTAHPDDKMHISKEIDFLKEIIDQPRIHVIALYDAVQSNSTLKWLAQQTASVMVQQAALAAFENLDNLLHFIKSLL